MRKSTREKKERELFLDCCIWAESCCILLNQLDERMRKQKKKKAIEVIEQEALWMIADLLLALCDPSLDVPV